MVNTAHTQTTHNIFQRQSQSANGQQPRRGVGQDNPTPSFAPSATPQPAPLPNHQFAPLLNRKTSRTENRHRYRKSAVKVTSWVKPVIKDEIEKLARSEGLSISAMSASLLEKALQQSLYLRYAALIDPLIEKAIAKHMRAYSNRIAILLVRSIFASEQTRSIVTNILGRQPAVTQPILEEILNCSSNAAKRNITRITPQLAELMKAIEQWMEKGGDNTHG